MDFNRKLIFSLIDLKKLISKITKDTSKPKNIFIEILKAKNDKKELRPYQLSNNLAASNLVFRQCANNRKQSKLASNQLKYNEVFKTQDSKSRLHRLVNLKSILNKKIDLEDRRKFSLKESKNTLKRKLSTKFESITHDFGQNQLINLNRLFCFYFLLIYSIYSLVSVLIERANNPTVNFTDYVKSRGNLVNISVSFCFEFEDLLSKEITEKIYRNLNLDYPLNIERELDLGKMDYAEMKKREDMYLNELYSLYNLEQLDKLTSNLTDIIDSIYLGLKSYSFSEKFFDPNETYSIIRSYSPNDLDPKVFYFKDSKCVKFFLSKTDFYFIFEIEYSFASFKFKKDVGGYYIEQDQEYPNKNSTIFHGTIDFQIRKIENKYEYCIDYPTEYGWCSSPEDCESKCVGQNYTIKLKRLSVNYPIVLNDENKHYFFDNETISSNKEKQSRHFWSDCYLKRKNDPCKDLKYYKFSTVYYREKEVFLYLSNDISQRRIEHRFKNVEIVNYMLNIGSLIYDLNLNVIINYLISLILLFYVKLLRLVSPRAYFNHEIKLRLKNFLAFLKFLVLLIGFLLHFRYVAYNYIHNNEPITSNLFDRPQNYIFIPNVTFCIGNRFHVYNETALKKSRFQNKTGRQLENEFPNLNDTFLRIEFKNQELNGIEINDSDIVSLESTGNYENSVYVSTYFLFESKCYTFSLSVKYNPLLFLTYNSIYPIRFELKSLREFHYSVFINDYQKYSFKNYINIERDSEFHIYYEAVRITNDLELKFRIKFNYYLRNEETYFFDDQADYFNFLLDEFAKDKNLTTTRIPLTKAYFHLKIDNKKFLDYYIDQHYSNEDDIFIQDLSYPVYRTISDSYDTINRTSVQLDPLFLEQHVQYRSRLSFNEAILYTGTLLSFWLNTCYIGLTGFLRRFFRAVKYYFKRILSYFK